MLVTAVKLVLEKLDGGVWYTFIKSGREEGRRKVSNKKQEQ